MKCRVPDDLNFAGGMDYLFHQLTSKARTKERIYADILKFRDKSEWIDIEIPEKSFFRPLCQNKTLCATFLGASAPDLFPKQNTYVFFNRNEDIYSIISEDFSNSNSIIIKPSKGVKGKGIHVLNQDDLLGKTRDFIISDISENNSSLLTPEYSNDIFIQLKDKISPVFNRISQEGETPFVQQALSSGSFADFVSVARYLNEFKENPASYLYNNPEINQQIKNMEKKCPENSKYIKKLIGYTY